MGHNARELKILAGLSQDGEGQPGWAGRQVQPAGHRWMVRAGGRVKRLQDSPAFPLRGRCGGQQHGRRAEPGQTRRVTGPIQTARGGIRTGRCAVAHHRLRCGPQRGRSGTGTVGDEREAGASSRRREI